MNGWSPIQMATGKPVSGVVTDSPVTKADGAPVTAGGSLNGIVKITYTGVTQVGTITPKVQTANGSDWVDVKSGTAITAAGSQYIRWNIEVAGDQAVLPLLSKVRVVVTTTNAGDAITFSSIELLQEL